MTVMLATTFNPRGEVGRLQRLYPQLQAVYDDIVISMPPVANAEDVAAVKALPGVIGFVNEDWSHGRYMALKKALDTPAQGVHYADMDRLLRWVELRPDEWRSTVDAVARCECLVIGRTEQAWATHPQALRRPEKITNTLFSHLLGQALDFGAGSKGFSRRAVEVLMANTQPGRALGTDAEWIVVLHRAGFRVESLLVDGLDWESADRYADQAADAEAQRRAAEAYDAQAKSWAYRIETIIETVESGLDAMQRPLNLD